MHVIGSELLTRARGSLKFILNDSGIVFFPATQQHRDIKTHGLSYEDDYRGNAVAGLITQERIEVRFHAAFSDEHIGKDPPSLSLHRASRLSSSMKTIAIVPLLAILAAGCSSSRFPTRYGVHEHEPNEFMFVSADGEKEWYSALEFDRIARRYAEAQRLAFDFQGTERTVWIKTDGGRVLADVSYSSGMGKPFLQVTINRHG